MLGVLALGWDAGAVAFAAGIASFFSPCVAPLVPGYMSFLAGTSAIRDPAVPASRLRGNPAVPVCLLFVGGFSATFVVLGLLAASFGSLLVAYRPVLETLAGIVMLVMGAFLLNLLPRSWLEVLSREWRLHAPTAAGASERGERVLKRVESALQRMPLGVQMAFGRWLPLVRHALIVGPSRGGRVQAGLAMPIEGAPEGRRPYRGLGSFGLGVIFAAGWTPCIGPVLGSILAYAAGSASAGKGALLLALYALGFALPFLAVGLGWSAGLRMLGWVRRYGHVVTIFSGIALMLLGLVYLTGEVTQISIWAQRIAPNLG